MAQLMHCHSLSLASVKSRLVLPFWYRLTRVVPDKGPLNGCVRACTGVLEGGNMEKRYKHVFEFSKADGSPIRNSKPLPQIQAEKRVLHQQSVSR